MMLHRVARLARALIVLAVVASGSWLRTDAAQPAGQTALPSPEQFFGFQMGADRKLANWDKLHEYYQTLAKTLEPMRLVELGKTSEGRPYIALFISSPANLAKLDRLPAAQRAAGRSARAVARPRRRSSSPKARAVVIQSLRAALERGRRRRRPPPSSSTTA